MPFRFTGPRPCHFPGAFPLNLRIRKNHPLLKLECSLQLMSPRPRPAVCCAKGSGRRSMMKAALLAGKQPRQGPLQASHAHIAIVSGLTKGDGLQVFKPRRL